MKIKRLSSTANDNAIGPSKRRSACNIDNTASNVPNEAFTWAKHSVTNAHDEYIYDTKMYESTEPNERSEKKTNRRKSGRRNEQPFTVHSDDNCDQKIHSSRRHIGLIKHKRKDKCSTARKRLSLTPALNMCGRHQSAEYRALYKAYFRMVIGDPSEELTVVKEMQTPLVKSSPVALPFDLHQAVADNCLSLSCMGYSLGVGSCCPTCSSGAEPKLGRRDRAALILAYVQQVNDIYKYRTFMASIIALADKNSQQKSHLQRTSSAYDIQSTAIHAVDETIDRRSLPQSRGTESILGKALNKPELFFAYHVLKEGGLKDARVLFYPDIEDPEQYMMYVVFPGKSVHLHYRLIDCLKSACCGYSLTAHIWQTVFLLVVRREKDNKIYSDYSEKVPAVNAEDVYCKLCDLNIDGELLLEYAKLYSMFDDFVPPERRDRD